GEDSVAFSLHRELISRKKQLALAESCTGGAIAAILTSMLDSSLYFLGSLVVYSNRWKEIFLEVPRTTLAKSGAVSKQAVDEMIQGLFRETDADFVIAISGIFGPSGGSAEKPVGTTYIGIGERGQKTDIGKLMAPPDRKAAIEWGVQTALGALWRRLVHGVLTFS
ncbi:MAG: CinA family protein, partial [Chlamydiae bacterium]|nr:CinA family protein [Chlamydiota bacterium]